MSWRATLVQVAYQGDEEDSKILGVFEHVAVFTGIDTSEGISGELCFEFAAI